MPESLTLQQFLHLLHGAFYLVPAEVCRHLRLNKLLHRFGVGFHLAGDIYVVLAPKFLDIENHELLTQLAVLPDIRLHTDSVISVLLQECQPDLDCLGVSVANLE